MQTKEIIGPVRWGILLSLIAFLFSVGLGVVFGAAEKSVKGTLAADAARVLDSVYKGDKAKSKKVEKKSWTYIKRAHLHGGVLGIAALAISLLLGLLQQGRRTAMAGSLLCGTGALGYGVFWLMAGFRAPALGSTGAAKESLAWLAIPSSSAIALGSVIALLALIKFIFAPRDN